MHHKKTIAINYGYLFIAAALQMRRSWVDYLLTHLPVGYSIKAKAEDLDYIIFAAEQERNVKAMKKP